MFALRHTLGLALLGQGKYALAEPLLVQGYQGLKQMQFPPSAQDLLSSPGSALVTLYKAWGKPEQAAMWRLKLEAFNTNAPAK